VKILQNKKILLVCDVNPSGGSFYFLDRLLVFLKSQGAKSFLILSNSGSRETLQSALTQKVQDYFIINDDKNFCRFDLLFPINILIERIKYKSIIDGVSPDITIISSSVPGRYFGLLDKSAPAVYVLHSYPTHSHNPFHQLEGLYLKNKLSQGKKRILTVSQFAAKSISTFWALEKYEKCLKIIPTGVKDHEYLTKSSEQETIRIVTIGTVVDYKNVSLWFEVAKEIVNDHHNVQFIWLGTGPLEEYYKRKVKIEKLDGKIVFYGHVKKVGSALGIASIYFQPSLIESQGIAAVEAMSYGLPLIVSNKGGLPELVQNGDSGYVVNVEDTASVKEAITKLIEDPNKRKIMGKASRKRFLSKYTFEKWTHNIENIFKDII